MNKNDRIVVSGCKGQLGFDCIKELLKRGYTNVIGIDIQDLDITNEEDVHNYILNTKPAVFMHNAAWTAVDKAEEFPDKVYQVNALGPKYIAEACHEIGAKMVFISTDYVFNGVGNHFFETDDKKEGLSIYGKTKSEGEDFVMSSTDKYFIVRTSWVFGFNGNNFVKNIMKYGASSKVPLNIVNDQIGSPTYTVDLAKLLVDMIETDKYGVYHATNEGTCSWAEFASYIFKLSGMDACVNPISTEEYLKISPKQAIRPLNSRLSKKSLDQAGFKRLPSWQDAVTRYIKNELKL